jgi:hypothetical protein
MSENPSVKVPAKIKFVYDKREEMQPVYVNGAFGGISPKGELICSFYFEHPDIPQEQRMPLVNGKVQSAQEVRVGRVSHDTDEVVMIRDIKAILIIPVQEISSIATWMLDKLKASNIVVERQE